MAALIYYPTLGSEWWNGTVTLNYTASYNAVTNQTTITFLTSSHKYYGRNGYGSNATTTITVTANDNTSSTATARLYTSGATNGGQKTYSGTPSPTSVVVQHNFEPGVKSVTIAGSTSIYCAPASTSTTQRYVTGNGSVTVQMHTIPAVSTVGATDAVIGAVSMLAVNRKSNNYTHSIQYEFGSCTGFISAEGNISETEVKHDAVNIPFSIPVAFYEEIPNEKSGICRLTITTYWNDGQVGEPQISQFTVNTSEDICKPDISGTVIDTNETTLALTGDSSSFVRFESTALCTVFSAAKNAASIISKKIAGTEVESSLAVEKFEASSVFFTVEDSRGYQNSISVPCSLVPYVKLTCNPSDSMIDPGTGIAVVKVKGSCYGGSFGVADNTLTIDYRIRSANGDFGSISSISPAIEANTYAVSISLEDLDYKTEYKLEITVRDALNTVQKTATIIRSIPIADWGEADFRFNVPVKMGDDVFLSEENDVITKKYAEKTFLSAIQSTDHSGCHYRIVDGATEWLIPPMELGVEYRTTERWNSKPVYTRIFDCGLSTSGNKSIEWNIGAQHIVRSSAVMVNGTGYGEPLPVIHDNNFTSGNYTAYVAGCAPNKIQIYSNTGMANRQTYAHIWYVKE